jgi:hypothetical protein
VEHLQTLNMLLGKVLDLWHTCWDWKRLIIKKLSVGLKFNQVRGFELHWLNLLENLLDPICFFRFFDEVVRVVGRSLGQFAHEARHKSCHVCDHERPFPIFWKDRLRWGLSLLLR